MINEPQNLSSSSISRFKPYVLHEFYTEGMFSRHNRRLKYEHIRKLHYKHIHTLNLEPYAKALLQRNPLPKTLRSLRSKSWLPGQNLPLVNKFVKSSKKYLRSVKGKAFYPEIHKLLSGLTELEASLTHDSLRLLPLNSNLKNLRFIITSGHPQKISAEEVLMKYKARFSRNLAKMKRLKNLSMMVMNKEAKAGILLLEIINQNLPLDSLKHLGFRFVSGLLTKSFQKLPEQKASISKVLSRLTYLDADSPAWYAFLISSGKLDNLTILHLKLASEEIHWDPKDIFQFYALPQLKDLSFQLKVHSESAERNFFENFSLPSSLENLYLSLEGFSLDLINDNEVLLSQFFKRLQEVKEVKTLKLNVAKNARNLTRASKFYCLFIECFSNLETLVCTSVKESSFLRKGNTAAEDKPLDFQDFWTAVTHSKETLQSISLNTNEIIFPQGHIPLETGFPRLQKLRLEDSISSATELGRFCLGIPSLTDVLIRRMKFEDCEGLRVFLDDMKEIPKGRNFEFYLHVGNITKGPLISCLKKYIEDVKVKSKLGIHFNGIPIQDGLEYEEVLKMAREKGCFQRFSIIGYYA